MKKQYDFSTKQAERNPYIHLLKQPVTMRLDRATVAYFKALAGEVGMPYQNLINLYLRDCAMNHRKLDLQWAAATAKTAASGPARPRRSSKVRKTAPAK